MKNNRFIRAFSSTNSEFIPGATLIHLHKSSLLSLICKVIIKNLGKYLAIIKIKYVWNPLILYKYKKMQINITQFIISISFSMPLKSVSVWYFPEEAESKPTNVCLQNLFLIDFVLQCNWNSYYILHFSFSSKICFLFKETIKLSPISIKILLFLLRTTSEHFSVR